MVAATSGAILASLERYEDEIHTREARRGVLLGVGAALGLGCFYVGTDAVADASVWWSLLASRVAALILIVAAILARRPAAPRKLSDFLPLAAIGALDLAASTFFVVSSTMGLLSVVSVIAALYPLITVLLAMALLHERIRTIQAIGVATAFGGVGLMAAG
jgi:drug/metabolite transporter (DMT)-like permease